MIDFEAFKIKVLRNAIFSAFFTQRRLFLSDFLSDYVFAGNKRAFTLECFFAVGARICGRQFSWSNNGQALRQVWFKRNCHFRSILLSCRNLNLFNNEHNFATLHCAYCFSRLRLRTSMFFPANNSAVMANARAGSFGSISGLLRTVQNIGLVGSYVLAISVAAASIPRQVAFEVFIGTTNLSGGVSQEFLFGIHNAFYASIAILGRCRCIVFQQRKGHKKSAPLNPKTLITSLNN